MGDFVAVDIAFDRELRGGTLPAVYSTGNLGVDSMWSAPDGTSEKMPHSGPRSTLCCLTRYHSAQEVLDARRVQSAVCPTS